MKAITSKNPISIWDEGDEFDWFDFKYTLGKAVASKFDDVFVKAVIETHNSFTGEPINGHKCFKLDESLANKDYVNIGAQVLSACFRQIGYVEVYSLSNRKGLVLLHKHHDNPVNGDKIILVPCSEKTYYKFAR